MPVFFAHYSQPPTAGTFFAPGCLGVCESAVSQDAADDCAAAQAFECSFDGAPTVGNPTPNGVHPPARFGNTVQECEALCADGEGVTLVIPANTVISSTQADADARAHGLACKRAVELKVCFVTASPLESIEQDVFASIPIVAEGGNGDYEFIISSGTIPTGMLFDPVGLLSGTPTVAGTYNFTITVTDTGGASATKAYQIEVIGLAPAAWWKMDGLVADPVDEVGPYTLAFSFNVLGTPGVAGKIVDAFFFSAVNNQSCVYQLNSTAALAYTGAGFESLFWLRFDAIASPGAGTCEFNASFLFVDGADFYVINLKYDDDANPNVLRLRLLVNSVQTAIVDVAHVPALGTWRFIHVRFDAASGKLGLSVDNAALSESAAAVIVPGTAFLMQIGSQATVASTMSVSIDELALFLANLNDAQVNFIYNSGAGTSCCPLA